MNGVSVAVLLIGVVIVLTEGALIARGGWEFLGRVYPDPQQAKRIAALVAGLAFLLMLGVVMLTATLGIGAEAGISTVLARVGVLFLLTAVVHVVVLVVLGRERAEEQDLERAEEQIDTTRARRRSG